MNMCPKCGTEFDGKFCPNCGEKWEEEKICPDCGAKLPGEVRFCNQCGYSFVENSAHKGNNASKQTTDLKQKVYSALRLVPFIAFALFSVLLFAFYSAPVAEMVWGMDMPNQNLGNVYGMYSGLLNQIPEIESCMLTLIIVAAISVAYACIMGLVQFKSSLKYNEQVIGIYRMSLPEAFECLTYVFYLIILIVGISIISGISSADEGMGILVCGACPVLLIVFSLLFAALSAGTHIARNLLAKKSPELKEFEASKKEEYVQAEKARIEKFHSTHNPPMVPKNGDKKAAIEYKHAKSRYDKAKEGSTPEAVIWLDLHKAAIIAVAIILAVAITLICILVPIFTNKFRIPVVEKIQPGYTQAQVTDILGEPYEAGDTLWHYFSDDYVSILDKIEENKAAQEKAFANGDQNKFLQLTNQATQLNEQLKNVTYDFIEIRFTVSTQGFNAVSSVLFEKDFCNTGNEVNKKVKSVTLSNNKVGYYEDNTTNPAQKIIINNSDPDIYYSAYYENGSFYRAYLKDYTSETESGMAVTRWSDQFASYQVTNEEFKIGEIDKDGNCTLSDSPESEKYFEQFYNDKKNWQNGVLYGGNLLFEAKDTLSGSYEIKEGTKIIADNSFQGCTNLTSIIIPESVTSIGSNAFNNCTGLTGVYITDLKAWCSIEFGNVSANPLCCAHNLYLNDNLVTEITADMLQGVIEIKNCVFAGFGGTSITIPDSVTSIGGSAFSGCTSLTSVSIGDGVTSIGSGAFRNCTSLESITIPDSVTSIGRDAFSGCSNLERINIPNGVISIGYGAFRDCTSLTSITIPDSVTSVGEGAFSNCTRLESVSIGNGVTSIGSGAFYDCRSLANITIPSSVTSIGASAFGQCISLTSITIPNGVTSIGGSTFYGCTGLTSITIPSSVTSIGDGAFEGCSRLTSITIPDSVTSIGVYAFVNCARLESVSIGDGVTSIGENAFYNMAYYNNNSNWTNGVLYIDNYLIKAKDTLSGSYTVNSGTKAIADYAFGGCTSLTSITIPNSVTSIGDGAFADCTNLTNVTIGNGVTSIGEYTFYYCTSLTSVKFENTSGWEVSYSSMSQSVDVTDPAQNAKYLTETYCICYWKRW